MGTPAYLAPEVLRGHEVTPACDVFAWGCVVAYAGTGRSPFAGANVSETLYRVAHDPPSLDRLDPDLRTLVEQALDKRPERRPSTGELLTHLVGSDDVERATKLLAARDVTIGDLMPTATWAPGARVDTGRTPPAPSFWRGHQRLLAAAGAVVLVAALALAAALIFLSDGTPAGTLTAGHSLTTNHKIESPNGEFGLIQQNDGNLVLYDKAGKALWQSDTDHHPNALTGLQGDGNLVVRDGSGPLWSSDTAGTPGARLVLGDNGQLVIRDRTGKVVWTAVHNV